MPVIRTARRCSTRRSRRPFKASKALTPIPPAAPTVVAQSYGSAGFAAPGTFALAMVFLTAFILYYFINWKYLSQLWGLS